jgi:hypothetical protein
MTIKSRVRSPGRSLSGELPHNVTDQAVGNEAQSVVTTADDIRNKFRASGDHMIKEGRLR